MDCHERCVYIIICNSTWIITEHLLTSVRSTPGALPPDPTCIASVFEGTGTAAGEVKLFIESSAFTFIF